MTENSQQQRFIECPSRTSNQAKCQIRITVLNPNENACAKRNNGDWDWVFFTGILLEENVSGPEESQSLGTQCKSEEGVPRQWKGTQIPGLTWQSSPGYSSYKVMSDLIQAGLCTWNSSPADRQRRATSRQQAPLKARQMVALWFLEAFHDSRKHYTAFLGKEFGKG